MGDQAGTVNIRNSTKLMLKPASALLKDSESLQGLAEGQSAVDGRQGTASDLPGYTRRHNREGSDVFSLLEDVRKHTSP